MSPRNTAARTWSSSPWRLLPRRTASSRAATPPSSSPSTPNSTAAGRAASLFCRGYNYGFCWISGPEIKLTTEVPEHPVRHEQPDEGEQVSAHAQSPGVLLGLGLAGGVDEQRHPHGHHLSQRSAQTLLLLLLQQHALRLPEEIACEPKRIRLAAAIC